MGRTVAAIIALTVALAEAATSRAEESASPGQAGRKPRDSWTLQFGLSHSSSDEDHYAVSGFHAHFPIFTLDRADKTDRLGSIGLEVGAYPYPVISRAYVPGPDADPETPGKYNFWEAVGLAYYTPRLGPAQFEIGARLAFIDPAERVLTSPDGCGANGNDASCNAYIKESLKTLDTILFPGFGGDQGLVTFVAAAVMYKRVGLRLEWAQLNSGGAGVNAHGLRFGITAR
jgi:hypothetical protein